MVRQKIEGILQKLEGDRCALVVRPGGPNAFLTFAFPVLSAEEYIVPESILDDWGHEITGLGLYDWVRENGARFPRAEVFGFNLDGKARQFFVRELEFYGPYPCFGSENETGPISEALAVEAILVADPSVQYPKQIDHPALKSTPIRYADVRWWLFNPNSKLDLSKIG